VARHAGACRAGGILETVGDEVRLIVEDDGIGFPTDDASAGAGRFGLVGMRERLALVHGRMDVETASGKGTTLFVGIPIERDAEP